MSDETKSIISAIGGLVIAFLVLGFVVFAFSTPAPAVWKPEYAQLSPSLRQWYQNANMTPETRARLKKEWWGCCNEGDVVKDAEFKVVRVGRDKDPEWWYRRPGTDWKLIHPDTVHWGDSAPDGKATLFIYNSSGEELCFYPAAGG